MEILNAQALREGAVVFVAEALACLVVFRLVKVIEAVTGAALGGEPTRRALRGEALNLGVVEVEPGLDAVVGHEALEAGDGRGVGLPGV